jgi:hypothetical protein
MFATKAKQQIVAIQSVTSRLAMTCISGLTKIESCWIASEVGTQGVGKILWFDSWLGAHDQFSLS